MYTHMYIYIYIYTHHFQLYGGHAAEDAEGALRPVPRPPELRRGTTTTTTTTITTTTTTTTTYINK